MAIKRMISREVEAFREFLTRTAEVGRIRLGEYVVPEGKRGRPVKLDRFRLTSPTEEYIRNAAEVYGGEVQQFQPQGGGPAQWGVLTPTNALKVWIVNQQVIDPVYEAWGAGRTCIRRCDGEWNSVMQEPCLCNDPERRPADPRQLCKITTRVKIMLPDVAGLNAWRLETHSENAAVEMAAPAVAGIVEVARVPVPATLYLRKEVRRERNHDKGIFETKDFYVPWFDIKLPPGVLAAGLEGLTQALTAAGAPSVLAAPAERRAIEAAPTSAVPVSTPPTPPAMGLDLALRAKILADIEGQETLDGLDAIKAKLQERGIDDPAVRAAWRSKYNAIEALDAINDQFADDLDAAMGGEPRLDREYQVGDTVTVGGIEFTKISDNPFPPGTPAAQVFAQAEVVEGPVEGDGDGLPVLPDGDYNFATEMAGLMMLAGQRTPPLTTDGVRKILVSTFQLQHAGQATGLQVARLAAAMREGLI